MKTEKLKKSIFSLFLFLIFIAGIHILLLDYVLPEDYMQIQVIYIYVFLGLFSIIGMGAIFLIQKNDETLIGKGFLVFSVLKVLGSFLFLLPWILNKDETTKQFIYQFFGVFFPTLIFETFMILKLVNQIEVEKKEK